MLNLLKKFHKEESGQDMIEYSMIAGIISVAAIALLGPVATKIVAEWQKVSNALT